MPTRILWKLNVEIPSGPNIIVANTVQADAYDRIEVKVPHSTAPSPTPTTVDVQPGAAGKMELLLIHLTSGQYGDDLKYKVHDNTTPERVLNEAVFLVGAGSMKLLEQPDPAKAATQLDKLLVTNTTGQDVVLEIIVGRSAT